MPHTVVCAVGAIIDLTHADQPSGDRATLSKKTLSRKWCPGTESNRRHCDFQSHALPTELPGHGVFGGASAGWRRAYRRQSEGLSSPSSRFFCTKSSAGGPATR